jgi:hypothetical protein
MHGGLAVTLRPRPGRSGWHERYAGKRRLSASSIAKMGNSRSKIAMEGAWTHPGIKR